MNDYRSFPNFFLFSAFAEEIGFTDLVRTPMTRDAFEKRKKERIAAGKRDELTYEQHVQSRAMLPAVRYYAIFGIVPRGQTGFEARMSDGVNRRKVEYEGLFEAVLKRVNECTGVPLLKRCDILPAPPIGHVADRELLPSHFVYFDSETSRGYVVPWDMFSHVTWTMNPHPQQQP